MTPGIDLPFWVDLGVTPEVVMEALGLAVASAVFAGVLPALRATGSSPQRTLQEARGGFRFGRVTGALIIAEVGLGVGALFAAGMTYRMFSAIDQETSIAMQTSRVLVASIDVPSSDQPGEGRDGADATRIARIASMQEALARQLAARPTVRSWAFSDATPGDGRFERRGRVEGDGFPPDFPGFPVVTSQVEPGFFGTLGIESLYGRTFERGDVPVEVGQAPTRVLVNTKFLDRRGMDYHSAVGQTMRISDPGEAPTGPWMEIIGVVPDLEASLGRAIFDGTPMAYLPAVPGGVYPLTLVIDLGGNPTAFAPVLRNLLADADPTAILSDVVALDELPNGAASGAADGIRRPRGPLPHRHRPFHRGPVCAHVVHGRPAHPRDRRAHRPRREIEPDRRVDRASITPPAHVRGHARYRVLGHRLHAAHRGRRVPGRARGRRAVVAVRAVDHGRDRRDDRPAGLPRANAERTKDPPGGGAARRRVVGGVGLMRFRARARRSSTCALVALGADIHARSAPRLRRIHRPTAGFHPTWCSTSCRAANAPILFAAGQGNLEAASYLVAGGAHVNPTAASGTSALVLAAHSGHTALALFLPEQGADPNAADAGYSALHAATLPGDETLAAPLLARGADPNASVKRGSPGRRNSPDYVLEHDIVSATALWLAPHFAELGIMRALADNGANPRVVMADGTTPLMAAVATRRRREPRLAANPAEDERHVLEVARATSDAGLDVNAAGAAGNPALHTVASRRLDTVVGLPADSGADLHAVNDSEADTGGGGRRALVGADTRRTP